MQNKINSKSNSKIKLLKKLQHKKHRDKEALFFVENFKIIEDAFRSGYVFNSLYLSDSYFNKNKKSLDVFGDKEVYILPDEVYREVSMLDTSPGVLALYSKPKESINYSKSVIYLNGVSDPGNLGYNYSKCFGFWL